MSTARAILKDKVPQQRSANETFELLKDESIRDRRGEVMIKGKGQMETWMLLKPRDAAG